MEEAGGPPVPPPGDPGWLNPPPSPQILPMTPQRAVLQDRDAPQPPPFLAIPTNLFRKSGLADAKQATTDEDALREDSFLRLKASVLKAFNIHRDNLRRRISQYEAAVAEISRLQNKLLEHNITAPENNIKQSPNTAGQVSGGLGA